MPDTPQSAGKLIDAFRQMRALELALPAGGIALLVLGIWRLIVRPEPFVPLDLLLLGMWVLIGFVVSLLLTYMLQHA